MLGDEVLRRYGEDLFNRLEQLDRVPTTWCTLGVSGDRFAELLIKLRPDSVAAPAEYARVVANRFTKKVQGRDGDLGSFGDEPILLLDSAIHSGASMKLAVSALWEAGASSILTYSLIVKRTTAFVPNYFGLVIDEHDRAFFQLEEYPNNKCVTSLHYGSVRALNVDDLERTPDHIATDVASLTKITFADLWYSMQTAGSQVFVFEDSNKILGYIHLKLRAGDRLFIDGLCSDESVRGKGVGKLLIRWAETMARASRCKAIDLWAIEQRVPWYKKHSYEVVEGEALDLGSEKYVRMRRRILYNLKPLDELRHLD